MESEDEAHTRVIARQEAREAAQSERQRLASIAGSEVDKRIAGWGMLVAFFVLIDRYGVLGFGAWVVLGIAWMLVLGFFERRRPGAYPGEVDLLAEDYVRHSILADLHDSSEVLWEVEDNQVHIANEDGWDDFWNRLERIDKSFESISPKERYKRMKKIKKRSYRARLDMEKFAKKNGAQLPGWARN